MKQTNGEVGADERLYDEFTKQAQQQRAQANSVNEIQPLSTASSGLERQPTGLPCPLKHHVSAGLRVSKIDPRITCLDCALTMAATDWRTLYERWNSRADIASKPDSDDGFFEARIRIQAENLIDSVLGPGSYDYEHSTRRQLRDGMTAALLAAHNSTAQPDSEDVEAALRELRDMFPKWHCEISKANYIGEKTNRLYTRFDIHLTDFGKNDFTEIGSTLAEAMQKVREWKEANQ